MLFGTWTVRAETWVGGATTAVGCMLLTKSNSSLTGLLETIAPPGWWAAVLICCGLATILTMFYRFYPARAAVMLTGSALWWTLDWLMAQAGLNIAVLWIGVPFAVCYSVGFGCAVSYISTGRACAE